MADRVGQQFGHYRLLRKIGQGAFAEVYLGEHLYLERPAAIKVLHVQLEPKTQEQFRREARTIAHLQHPHIVQVHDFGLADQTPYLVMEYTPGGTLRSHHSKGTRLSLEEIVTYVNQIASALDYAHKLRVIHRDIKPENLLLTARHQIVLSDFGLAVVQRSLDSLSTQDSAGSPLYMAPEQIQGHPCAASDQYALGIIVYEWLAGEAPFRGPLFEVFSHHLYQPPPSLRERLPDLSVAVEEAVFKALAKNPAQRFACVEDFASALEEACSAIQPLTPQGFPKPQTHEPTVSQNIRFVPASPVREQADGSFSTQPQSITMQRTGPGQEGVSLIAPGPVLDPQSVSKGEAVSKQTKKAKQKTSLRTFKFTQSIPGNGVQVSGTFAVFVGILLVLLVGSTGYHFISLRQRSHITITPTPQITPTSIPLTSACRPPGTAYANPTSTFSVGNDPTIIYSIDDPSHDLVDLESYDTTTGKRTEIVKMSGTQITDPEVSKDGQRILFTTYENGQTQLHTIRIDGQQLNTLYCSVWPLDGATWSKDQKWILFTQDGGGDHSASVIYLLNTANGTLQPEVLIPAGTYLSDFHYVPLTWFDEKRALIESRSRGASGSGAGSLFELDTTKGANQRMGDLQHLSDYDGCDHVDSSPDGKLLFTSLGVCDTAASIQARPTTGGTAKTIWASQTLVVQQILAISSTTLLIIIKNDSGDTSQNGLWKMRTDGTGLTRIIPINPNNAMLLASGNDPWSKVSRDGNMYTLVTYNADGSLSLSFGSLNGGTPTVFASAPSEVGLDIIGWTTI